MLKRCCLSDGQKPFGPSLNSGMKPNPPHPVNLKGFHEVTSNQSAKTLRFVHFASSAQVLDSSCGAVFAVMTPRLFGRVLISQFTSIAVVALLLMP